MTPARSVKNKNTSKIIGKKRTLKNIINKPRNDYPELANNQSFLIANGENIIFKLHKKEGNISVSSDILGKLLGVEVVNLFTGKFAHEDTSSENELKLFQISKDGKEVCRVTVGGGLIANIKKTDLNYQLDAWVEV
jgi:hypothetical protein